jgi:hypothetical protein
VERLSFTPVRTIAIAIDRVPNSFSGQSARISWTSQQAASEILLKGGFPKKSFTLPRPSKRRSHSRSVFGCKTKNRAASSIDHPRSQRGMQETA